MKKTAIMTVAAFVLVMAMPAFADDSVEVQNAGVRVSNSATTHAETGGNYASGMLGDVSIQTGSAQAYTGQFTTVTNDTTVDVDTEGSDLLDIIFDENGSSNTDVRVINNGPEVCNEATTHASTGGNEAVQSFDFDFGGDIEDALWYILLFGDDSDFNFDGETSISTGNATAQTVQETIVDNMTDVRIRRTLPDFLN